VVAGHLSSDRPVIVNGEFTRDGTHAGAKGYAIMERPLTKALRASPN
jgi:lysophospholipase L1-like esterase